LARRTKTKILRAKTAKRKSAAAADEEEEEEQEEELVKDAAR